MRILSRLVKSICFVAIVSFFSSVPASANCDDETCRDYQVTFETITYALEGCTKSLTDNGMTETTRRKCLFSIPTSAVYYKQMLKKHGPDSKLTQFAAFAEFQASYYVTASYLELAPERPSLPWIQGTCKYNDRAKELSGISFSKLQSYRQAWVKQVVPNIDGLEKTCATVPE